MNCFNTSKFNFKSLNGDYYTQEDNMYFDGDYDAKEEKKSFSKKLRTIFQGKEEEGAYNFEIPPNKAAQNLQINNQQYRGYGVWTPNYEETAAISSKISSSDGQSIKTTVSSDYNGSVSDNGTSLYSIANSSFSQSSANSEKLFAPTKRSENNLFQSGFVNYEKSSYWSCYIGPKECACPSSSSEEQVCVLNESL